MLKNISFYNTRYNNPLTNISFYNTEDPQIFANQ